jgi:hypothetical protein
MLPKIYMRATLVNAGIRGERRRQMFDIERRKSVWIAINTGEWKRRKGFHASFCQTNENALQGP